MAIALGGLRVSLAAWTRGEDRAEVHQHSRGLVVLLTRTLAAAYPYKMTPEESADAEVQFDGHPDRLSFVTLAPPVPLGPTIAFTAVTLSVDSGDAPGLAVRERLLPNKDPFADTKPQFHDPSVTAIAFRYRSPEGKWQATWNPEEDKGLPLAVEIKVQTTRDGRNSVTIPITVGLKTAKASEEE